MGGGSAHKSKQTPPLAAKAKIHAFLQQQQKNTHCDKNKQTTTAKTKNTPLQQQQNNKHPPSATAQKKNPASTAKNQQHQKKHPSAAASKTQTPPSRSSQTKTAFVAATAKQQQQQQKELSPRHQRQNKHPLQQQQKNNNSKQKHTHIHTDRHTATTAKRHPRSNVKATAPPKNTLPNNNKKHNIKIENIPFAAKTLLLGSNGGQRKHCPTATAKNHALRSQQNKKLAAANQATVKRKTFSPQTRANNTHKDT